MRAASTAPSARRPTAHRKFGDRAGYQMDPANAREAHRARRASTRRRAPTCSWSSRPSHTSTSSAPCAAESTLPLFAYNVSGEYSMLKAAAAAGMIDYGRAMMEVLTSIRRAGADAILTYHAIEAAEALG